MFQAETVEPVHPQDRRGRISRMLSPRSIALVGASNQAARIGGTLFANLKRAFHGRLYPVHPSEAEIMGVRAYASLSEIEDPVDLAVIAVPGRMVPEVVEEAIAIGVSGAVVVTAGFAEIGGEGVALQDRIVEISRRGGLPLIGPNCIGFMNVHEGVVANFSIDPHSPLPPAGGVALVSQSGGFGSYIATMATKAGLGLGWFVSTGNEADLSVAAMLRHLVEQPEVKVLLAAIETLRHPDVFIETAQRALELDKPIILLKAGRSEDAARAAVSHTGAIAGSAEVLDAVCAQFGVHVATTMQDMLDLGLMFQTGKRTTGRRLAILTSSGGAGVLLADEAARAGLSIPVLPEEEQVALLSEMVQPFYGSVTNPVDTTAQAMSVSDTIERLLNRLEKSPTVDMVTAVVWEQAKPHLDALVSLDHRSPKPVSILSTGIVPAVSDAGTPLYVDPARAVRTLGALARQSLDRPMLCLAEPVDEARVKRARAILALASGRGVLMEHEGKRLFAEYGLPITQERLVSTPAEAAGAASTLGGKVVLKAMSPALPHKSNAGGVCVDIAPEQAEHQARAMLANVARAAPIAPIEGILVQEMVPARIELTAGIKRDQVFGPIVVVGLGGVMVEILAEIIMLRPPFNLAAAHNAVEGLCGGRMVRGDRGLDTAEVEIVATIMAGLASMALELPEIEEVDANPIRIFNGRAVIADALVTIDREWLHSSP